MSRGLRIALILVAIVLFLCCVAGLGMTLLGTRLVGRAFITNPDRVQAVGREIADYDVPPGYDEMFAMNVLGMQMVAIGPRDQAAGTMAIMLAQFPAGVGFSQQEIERQMKQALARQIGLGGANMAVVGQEQVVIRGEPVTLTVREGTAEDGEPMRQVTGLFQGKAGPAMLMVIGEANTWDQATLDRFIASIR